MTFDSPVALKGAIEAACLGDGIDAGAVAAINAAASASPVPVIVAAMHAIHAARASASPAWIEIGQACAGFVSEHDWFGQGAAAAALDFGETA
jgi:hypothetical protein